MTLKRGFEIPEGTRVLIVEDIVTTGGSVKEVLDVVKEHGGVPVGIGLLVDRSGGKVDFGMRTEHCCIWMFLLTTRTTARSAKKANRLQSADVPVNKKFKI